MNPFDPILDQPQSIDTDAVAPDIRYRLANQEIVFYADAWTDLHDLVWPWADQPYLRSLRLHVSDPQHDELMPMVVRFYPGYQETILGSEGMIISKRLAAPLGSADERAVMWMLDCQAEGDRLMRLDIEIDWGEPLTQRIVDGLLVAQRNPGQARGIYAQHNAESTRVFGNPHGRPTALELHADGTARLTYYVLVNGMVEVPLVLTISDVGEQVAWNAFLGMRDAERIFELSTDAWSKAVKAGRLWTADPRLNRAVGSGRLATLRHLQKVRSGMIPSDRRIAHLPHLVRSLDTFNLILSRNLLAHARRVAERSGGKLPTLLPLRPKDTLPLPGPEFVHNNRAYLQALLEHLRRHPDPDLLTEHYGAVQAVAAALLDVRRDAQGQVDAPTFAAAGLGLRHAVVLATQQHKPDDVVGWEREACELENQAEAAGHTAAATALTVQTWATQAGFRFDADRPWGFDDPWRGIELAGEAVWTACGLQRRQGKPAVYPKRGNAWRWWALLDLPLDGATISLVWDGETLHSTQPISSDRPVQLYQRIRAQHTDELDFQLTFEMTPAEEAGGMAARHHFRPTFDLPPQADATETRP
jgi:hypothetical protein